MSISASEKLKKFYSCFASEDRVLVLINADPDAIACAMSVRRLLWRKVSGVTIAHINVVKRPDNLTMIRLLGANMVHISEIESSGYSRVVIVDSQPDHHECFAMFKPDVIIDHHPETCAVGKFCDIRQRYGAASSILVEYLKAARIKPSAKLATALYYGIKTDTNMFQRQAAIEDVKAFQYLFRYANLHLESRIEQAEIAPDFLKYYQKAISEKLMRRNRIFVHLEEVVNPDVCVLIADFFLKVHTVNWTIVSGTFENKLIIVFRNDGIRKHAGNLAKQVFGPFGSAGGHKAIARAELPFESLEGEVDYRSRSRVLRWLIRKVEKRTDRK